MERKKGIKPYPNERFATSLAGDVIRPGFGGECKRAFSAFKMATD